MRLALKIHINSEIYSITSNFSALLSVANHGRFASQPSLQSHLS